MNKKKLVSVVIPAYNEEESIPKLCAEIKNVFLKMEANYEIIIIDDGSTDGTWFAVERLHKKNPRVRGVQFYTNTGKAAALHIGFSIAKGDIIITMDADLQDDPNEIPKFLAELEKGYDLVSGWKKNRRDSFIKNNTSKIYNFVTVVVSGIKLHDFNCGFKAYRSEYVKKINLYGELHRYIPLLMKRYGCKITEIEVNHRQRKFGKSKYGVDRFIKGFLDIFTVLFITRFDARPLHFFGYVGISFFTIGFFGGVYLSVLKIFTDAHYIDHLPLLLLSITMMIMGVQITISGLISEQIAAVNTRKNSRRNIKEYLSVDNNTLP